MFWCLLSVFSLKAEIFLVLCMSIKLRFHHRYFEYYVRRLWVSFKACGVRWYFCVIRNQPSGSNRFSTGCQTHTVLSRSLLHVIHPATLSQGWQSIHSQFSGSLVWCFRVRLRHMQPGGEPSISYTAAWGCFPSPSLSMASPGLSSSLGLYSPLAGPHCAAHSWQQSLNPRPRSGTEWFL